MNGKWWAGRVLCSAVLCAAVACGSSSNNNGSTTTSGGSTGSTGQTGLEVTMSNFQFSPSLITVTAGQTVTWRNTDTIDHTVTSGANGQASGLFDQRLNPGATFQFTFNQAGTFPYFCKFHVGMGMAATVSVQAAGTGGSSGTSGSTGTTGTTTTGTSATTTSGNTGGYTTGY